MMTSTVAKLCPLVAVVALALMVRLVDVRRVSCINTPVCDFAYATVNGVKYCQFATPERACLKAGEYKSVDIDKARGWTKDMDYRIIGCSPTDGGRVVAASGYGSFAHERDLDGLRAEVKHPKTACDQRDVSADKADVLAAFLNDMAVASKPLKNAFGEDAVSEILKGMDGLVAKLK